MALLPSASRRFRQRSKDSVFRVQRPAGIAPQDPPNAGLGSSGRAAGRRRMKAQTPHGRTWTLHFPHTHVFQATPAKVSSIPPAIDTMTSTGMPRSASGTRPMSIGVELGTALVPGTTVTPDESVVYHLVRSSAPNGRYARLVRRIPTKTVAIHIRRSPEPAYEKPWQTRARAWLTCS
jgi:hypothetical protein